MVANVVSSAVARRVAFGLTVLSLLGCATTQLTTTYRTLGTVEATVSTGMSIYFDLVLQGKVPADKQREVKTAYNAYYGALQAAHAAVAAYNAGTASGDPLPTVNAAIAAANVLLPVLRALGVNV